MNPFRYRGYYWDSETGFYYLQSRYYDPAIGRFINADNQLSTGDFNGMNLYAYCDNNPVMRIDPTGEEWWHWVIGIAAVAITALTLGAAVPMAACTASVMAASLGFSATAISAVSTATTIVGYATVVAASAYAADVAYQNVTGDSLLLPTVFQGNETAYNIGLLVTSIVSYGLLEMAANSPGICFVEGTLVLAKEGHVTIENIQAGDFVWAHNPETGETELKQVVQTFVNETDELVHVYTGKDEIICTNDHPFYSPVKGWTAASKLRAGDILVTVNGEYVVVEKVQHEILESPVKVYNFEVEGFHTYYVGSEDGVLVHNNCENKRQIGKTPRNNQVQNEQFNSIVKEYNLSKSEARRLHDAISKQGYGRDEIIDEMISLFPDKRR